MHRTQVNTPVHEVVHQKKGHMWTLGEDVSRGRPSKKPIRGKEGTEKRGRGLHAMSGKGTQVNLKVQNTLRKETRENLELGRREKKATIMQQGSVFESLKRGACAGKRQAWSVSRGNAGPKEIRTRKIERRT